MAVQELAVLAALVSCAGITYATSRYLRVRHDFYLRNAWRATILLSIGLILSVHAVTVGIDRWIGLPNAARWLENALIACSGYYADLVHVAMIGGIAASRRQHRWTVAWLAAVVIALALLLWRAQVPELASFSLPTPNLWLVFYRFVWLSFLTFVIVRLIVYNRRCGQITPDPIIRLTTLAMVVAGLFALGVIVTTMAEPLLPATSSAVYPLRVLLELCVLGMATSFIFSTLPTWNPRLGGPTVARRTPGGPPNCAVTGRRLPPSIGYRRASPTTCGGNPRWVAGASGGRACGEQEQRSHVDPPNRSATGYVGHIERQRAQFDARRANRRGRPCNRAATEVHASSSWERRQQAARCSASACHHTPIARMASRAISMAITIRTPARC
jgi:hypothetical protein